MLYTLDDRKAYGEARFVAYVPREGKLYAVCLTPRQGALRIISFRRANKREERHYAQRAVDR